ncbi:hypothetical protein PRCB_02905 [Pantoea rodasii]|uniref:ABC transporter domain-containing protein n=1 Tax=Pantoea rodasii TaxID=1076549 RepID=A0A2M9WHD9_9GAMM|nr:ATP-binding cassette domain-containing protein [Pantoea rodasii]ORM61995.1 hypothetical protein HA45_19370 [Pantoea rodasii]PJZ06980.1 hypothetical protein PRCB_02905 [Pantoea rodasii]
MNTVLEAEHLSKIYHRRGSLFAKAQHQVHAVKSLSLQLARGETLAVVGESGSGKSTLARMLVGLESPTSGVIMWGGNHFWTNRRTCRLAAIPLVARPEDDLRIMDSSQKNDRKMIFLQYILDGKILV